MIKLRILQRYGCPFLWTCHDSSVPHMFDKVGLGDTPEEAYYRFFFPVTHCGLNEEWFDGERND